MRTGIREGEVRRLRPDSLLRGPPAVDDETGSRHERCRFGSDKDDGRGHFIELAQAPHWNAVEHPLCEFRTREHRRRHRSIEESGIKKLGIKSLSLTLVSAWFQRNRIEAFLQPAVSRIKISPRFLKSASLFRKSSRS